MNKSDDSTFKVGETVRLARPDIPKATGRATIATIQVEDQTACVMWEPLAPKPLPLPSLGKRRLKRSFLVAPLIPNGDIEEESETTVKLFQLQSLLEFECHGSNNDVEASASLMKEHGDQLLRLGDASAACSYYEAALRLSSILQVGSAVIVKAGGYTKVADVDCLDDDDDDDTAIEISMVESGEEKVVPETEILLCIFYNDNETHLQERLLLNLARCLLQLAELAKHQKEMASERRSRFLKSAVLATTLALTIANHHEDDDDADQKSLLTNLEQTSLLLRAQAQASLSKYPNAITDLKRLIKTIPSHKEGMRQLQIIQGQQQKLKQVDKKLVKSMCKWVKTATAEDDSKLLG